MTLPGSWGHILDEGVVSNDPVHVTELAMSDEEEELEAREAQEEQELVEMEEEVENKLGLSCAKLSWAIC